jgi:hypothetical protein
MGAVVGLLVALLIAVGAILVSRNDGGATSGGLTPVAPASPSTTVVPDPRTARHVVRTFRSGKAAIGQRFSLLVPGLVGKEKSRGCDLHSVPRPKGKPGGAYLTGCAFLENEGYQVILINVSLRNVTGAPVEYNLRNFILISMPGPTYGAVNIRSVKGVAGPTSSLRVEPSQRERQSRDT